MAKFAVYFIPPADTDLYRRGSEILGYDVRTGQMLPDDNPTRRALPEFDPAWTAQPQTYGFHVTAGYSLYFERGDLPGIERELEIVLGCFSADRPITLTPSAGRLAFWQENIVVLPYEPNPAMLMLHTMLIARINPFGTGSNISRAYQQHGSAAPDPIVAHRVRHFHTPYMLDDWKPHFTLMMPYTGAQPEAMRHSLSGLFDGSPVRVGTISLLVRDDHETHYRLHRDFCVGNGSA